MKSIAKYIKEGFFGNLGIDIIENIRRIFDKINNDKYHDIYHIALNYNTCQIIIHNGKHKTDKKDDIIINMLDFPKLIDKLSKSKNIEVLVLDQNTLPEAWYNMQASQYGLNIIIISFRYENAGDRPGYGYRYSIKYDKEKHIASEIK